MSHKLYDPWISGRISQRYLQIPKFNHTSIYEIVLVYLQRIIVSIPVCMPLGNVILLLQPSRGKIYLSILWSGLGHIACLGLWNIGKYDGSTLKNDRNTCTWILLSLSALETMRPPWTQSSLLERSYAGKLRHTGQQPANPSYVLEPLQGHPAPATSSHTRILLAISANHRTMS